MNGFMRGFGGVLGALAVVGAGAGVAYGVATWVGGSSAGDEARVQETAAPKVDASASTATSATPSATKTMEVGGLLRTQNRDHLALCVDAINVPDASAIEAAAIDQIQEAVGRVKENPEWAKVARAPGLATAPAEVASGCPAAPAAMDPTAGPLVSEFVVDNVGRSVDLASPYLFHVYIVPEGELYRIVGSSENYHFGAEEIICYGDECTPVTVGLYFSPTELSDPALVARQIEFVIGLR